jgi:hypothetical protein
MKASRSPAPSIARAAFADTARGRGPGLDARPARLLERLTEYAAMSSTVIADSVD